MKRWIPIRYFTGNDKDTAFVKRQRGSALGERHVCAVKQYLAEAEYYRSTLNDLRVEKVIKLAQEALNR